MLDHFPVKEVKIFQGSTTYTPSIDYMIDSNTGTVKRLENSSITADSTVTVE